MNISRYIDAIPQKFRMSKNIIL